MQITGGCRLPRALNGAPGAIDSYWYSHDRSRGYLGGSGNPYPSTADAMLHAWPIEVWDVGSDARGLLPGMLNPTHVLIGPLDGVIQTSLDGHALMIQRLGNNQAYGAVLDLTGPWR